jgi:hypothetical protein
MSLHKVSIALTSLLILAAGAPAFAQSSDNTATSVTESLGRSAPVRVNRELNNPTSNNYIHIDNLNLSDFVGRDGRSAANNYLSHQRVNGAGAPSGCQNLRK